MLNFLERQTAGVLARVEVMTRRIVADTLREVREAMKLELWEHRQHLSGVTDETKRRVTVVALVQFIKPPDPDFLKHTRTPILTDQENRQAFEPYEASKPVPIAAMATLTRRNNIGQADFQPLRNCQVLSLTVLGNPSDVLIKNIQVAGQQLLPTMSGKVGVPCSTSWLDAYCPFSVRVGEYFSVGVEWFE